MPSDWSDKTYPGSWSSLAEYRALLLGLQKARDLGLRKIHAFSDSELLVCQLNGAFAEDGAIVHVAPGAVLLMNVHALNARANDGKWGTDGFLLAAAPVRSVQARLRTDGGVHRGQRLLDRVVVQLIEARAGSEVAQIDGIAHVSPENLQRGFHQPAAHASNTALPAPRVLSMFIRRLLWGAQACLL